MTSAQRLRVIESLGRCRVPRHDHGADENRAGERASSNFIQTDDPVSIDEQGSLDAEPISLHRHDHRACTPTNVTWPLMPSDESTDPVSCGTHVFVVPLKSFAIGKARLRRAGTLGVNELARQLASDVLASCAPGRVIVVCESDDVEEFARQRGVEVVRAPHHGLNPAVTFAYHQLGPDVARVTVVHGDLREPRGLGAFTSRCDVTIVTDVGADGTNVLSLPAGLAFVFQYGPGSAIAHASEARRLGLTLEVVRDSPWCVDVDEPSDLLATEPTNGEPGAPHSSVHP